MHDIVVIVLNIDYIPILLSRGIMQNDLKMKCENLTVLLPSNLYLYGESGRLSRFVKLTAPSFLARHMENVIKKFSEHHLTAEDLSGSRVLLYQDSLHLWYLSFRADEYDEPLMITCGPILTEQLSADEVRYAAQKTKLGSENRMMFETFLGIVPFFGQEALERLGRVLREYFHAAYQGSEFVLETHVFEREHGVVSIDEKFEEHSYVLENYALEAQLLHAVTNGDVDFIRANLGANMHSFTMPPRYPGDPLRETKNLSITANSIILRAAIAGGLNPSLAHSISHTFAVKIEQQTSSDALRRLLQEIAITYAQAVREYALKEHTDLIVRTINYIRRNLCSPISLTDIARELHISREYLCRKFADEMHVTITDYIHQSKIRESCLLLSSKKCDIGEIAVLLGYSSPSHYSRTFKKTMNMSPKSWQALHSMPSSDNTP